MNRRDLFLRIRALAARHRVERELDKGLDGLQGIGEEELS
jgi:hypothetical protein